MLTTTTHTMQADAYAGIARPGTALACASRGLIDLAWTAITGKPMNVRTFHDRWPLCST